MIQRSALWATHSEAEMDLVVRQGTKLRGFEIKRTTAPACTRSMRSVLRDLNLSRIDLIHAGTESFVLDKQVYAVVAQRFLRDVAFKLPLQRGGKEPGNPLSG